MIQIRIALRQQAGHTCLITIAARLFLYDRVNDIGIPGNRETIYCRGTRGMNHVMGTGTRLPIFLLLLFIEIDGDNKESGYNFI